MQSSLQYTGEQSRDLVESAVWLQKYIASLLAAIFLFLGKPAH